MLFGVPDVKDAIGSDALSDRGVIAEATRALKKAESDLLVFTDLRFCEYTDHGHCGVIDSQGGVDNDATLANLAKQALIHAKAGSDCVCPSGMMDGMVGAIRAALDANGFENLPILSYSTKFASAHYGHFRDAAQSAPSFGDRRGYQMNPANAREAIAESLEDEAQGADMLMVKPALAYLDITRTLRDRTNLPIAVYNVSGEYAMLKAAQKLGLIDYDRALTGNDDRLQASGRGYDYHLSRQRDLRSVWIGAGNETFLSLKDYKKSEILEILSLAHDMKRYLKANKPTPALSGKSFAMIFEKSSTRTRVSFEISAAQLGMRPIFLSSRDIQLGRGEPMKDTARVISRMVDMAMIRTFAHSRLEEFAAYSSAPVINGLSDDFHPAQLMADYMTMQELGHDERSIAAWIGDGNNMANSWSYARLQNGL
jgi:delta-aminolevulinic acid dehydratase/porphobilinogen synthase